jgi:L-ascorbate metabolism protein UlaG (beta-lactamase superfamily)
MKRGTKIILLFAVVTGFLTYNFMHAQQDFKRVYNPDLSFVKDDWQGNVSANGRFYNDTIVETAPFRNVLKWQLSRNPQRKEKKQDTFQLQVIPITDFAKNEDYIVWLGHSTFVISINGTLLLTDPIFFDLPTGKRKVSLPCDVNDLQNIDYLLISHDHRDHFDRKSVEALIENNSEMTALIPLGGNRLFRGRKLREIKQQEAGWYQEYNISEDIRIIFLPAKHWARRGLNDFNKTLWGNFLIISGDTKIFFAGDTAYCEHLFKEIRQLFGDIDVCLFPIGAYSPAFMMQNSHTNPEEALQAFSDLGGKLFIPTHYGTYDLSDEPLGEPIKRLRQRAAEKGIEHQIKELAVGEKFLLE